LAAVIAHEIGHITMRHGMKELMTEQARYDSNKGFSELDKELDESTLNISKDLEDSIVKNALNAIKLVRSDIEEYEADSISKDIIKRYKIDKSYLISALTKMQGSLSAKYPEYKESIKNRIQKLKK